MKRRTVRSKQQYARAPAVDPSVESEEFKLLHKLFVPNNVLIKNNQVLIPQLVENLPQIVADSDINLGLHLFAASVMVNYVSSWYMTKLNTDNWEFVQIVYRLITDVLRDAVARLRGISISELGNQCCEVLVEHLDDLLGKIRKRYVIQNDEHDGEDLLNLTINPNPSTRIFSQSYKNDSSENTLQDCLRKNHVMFSDDCAQLTYYRALARGILQNSLGSVQSKITDDLITLLVSDLVLVKVVDKLSSPKFLFGLLIKVIEGSKKNNEEEKTNENIDLQSKKGLNETQSLLHSIWEWITHNSNVLFGKPEQYETSIFNTHIFSLFNVITNFSSRKPLLSGIFKYLWNAVSSNRYLSERLNCVVMSQIETTTDRILSPVHVSRTINDLRLLLFRKTQDESEDGTEEPTLNEIAQQLAQLIIDKIPRIPLSGERDPTALAQEIAQILLVFNYSEDEDNNMVKEHCDLNKLLVINMVDCIVSNMYPEMVDQLE